MPFCGHGLLLKILLYAKYLDMFTIYNQLLLIKLSVFI